MLLKPTMGVAHGGGLRFAAGSRYYKTLLEWIRQGVSYADEKEGMVVKLNVVPPEIFMNKPGLTQQVLALAEYPDGSQRDVTAESVYVSSTPSVAESFRHGRGEVASKRRNNDTGAVPGTVGFGSSHRGDRKTRVQVDAAYSAQLHRPAGR